MIEPSLALVTGANRGLGLETCRQLGQLGYQVILTSRNAQQGREKAKQLIDEGFDVTFIQLDIENSESILEAYKEVKTVWGRLDVLVNNAAILLDKEKLEDTGSEENMARLHREILEKTLKINVSGAYEMCEVFGQLMSKYRKGRIVNVSSGTGQLSEMGDLYPAYSISKASLNAVTRVFAARFKHYHILVNSVCPGWVKTDMGGSEAPRSLEEGAKSIVWAVTLPDGGPTGGFFRDGKPLNW